jgi:hypothetical protein
VLLDIILARNKVCCFVTSNCNSLLFDFDTVGGRFCTGWQSAAPLAAGLHMDARRPAKIEAGADGIAVS